jgi:hypothetical protein
MDGDHRDRLFRRDRADNRKNLGARQSETAGARRFDLNEVAVLGAADEFGIDIQLVPRLSIGMMRPLPSSIDRKTPRPAVLRLSMTLMTRAV